MTDDDRTELDDWRQAAKVEASLRREFLARAERAEAEIERLQTEVASLKASCGYEAANQLTADNERLRAAIRWALGEVPNEAGEWFHEVKPPLGPMYWWRFDLRRALEQKP